MSEYTLISIRIHYIHFRFFHHLFLISFVHYNFSNISLREMAKESKNRKHILVLYPHPENSATER
ncbi:hypothetical protein JHK86_019042 [Glycine max]|nr:hypothetical protein JHK86_019042 [Glycine max]